MISRRAESLIDNRAMGKTVQEMLLINPTKRKARKMARKTRTAAQRRATAKLVALNRARRRAKNPAPRRRTRAKSGGSKSITIRQSNPVRRIRRRRNPTNPVGGAMGLINSALLGTAGATLVNVTTNFLPLPPMLSTGYAKYLTRGALAIVMGLFGRRLMGRNALKMAEGALTVALTDAVQLAGAGMKMNLGYYAPAEQYVTPAPMLSAPGMGEYMSGMGDIEEQGVGEYMSGYDDSDGF